MQLSYRIGPRQLLICRSIDRWVRHPSLFRAWLAAGYTSEGAHEADERAAIFTRIPFGCALVPSASAANHSVSFFGHFRRFPECCFASVGLKRSHLRSPHGSQIRSSDKVLPNCPVTSKLPLLRRNQHRHCALHHLGNEGRATVYLAVELNRSPGYRLDPNFTTS